MYYNLQRKTCNPKVFKSFSFDDQFPDNPYHRIRAEIDYYKKYNYQSQISNLPGGLKRKMKLMIFITN